MYKKLNKYRGFIFILLAFIFLGLVKALLDTNKYSVQSKFIIKPLTQSENLFQYNLLELNDSYNQVFLDSRYFSTLIYSTDFILKIIKSTENLESTLFEKEDIIINDELQENINYLKKSIIFDVNKETDLITLTTITENSEKSLELLLKVKYNFIETLQKTYRNSNLATIDFLDKEIRRIEIEIDELENDFITYNDSNQNLIKTSLIFKQQALKNKIEAKKELLKTLILQKNNLTISNNSGGYTVINVENSYPTTFKTSIRKLFIVIIYSSVGFLIGMFFEIYKFILVRDIKSLTGK